MKGWGWTWVVEKSLSTVLQLRLYYHFMAPRDLMIGRTFSIYHFNTNIVPCDFCSLEKHPYFRILVLV